MNCSRSTSHINILSLPRSDKWVHSFTWDRNCPSQLENRQYRFLPSIKNPVIQRMTHKYLYLFILSRPAQPWNLIDIINFETLLFLDIFWGKFCYHSMIYFIALGICSLVLDHWWFNALVISSFTFLKG